jgi:hypothetical protein
MGGSDSDALAPGPGRGCRNVTLAFMSLKRGAATVRATSAEAPRMRQPARWPVALPLRWSRPLAGSRRLVGRASKATMARHCRSTWQSGTLGRRRGVAIEIPQEHESRPGRGRLPLFRAALRRSHTAASKHNCLRGMRSTGVGWLSLVRRSGALTRPGSSNGACPRTRRLDRHLSRAPLSWGEWQSAPLAERRLQAEPASSLRLPGRWLPAPQAGTWSTASS